MRTIFELQDAIIVNNIVRQRILYTIFQISEGRFGEYVKLGILDRLLANERDLFLLAGKYLIGTGYIEVNPEKENEEYENTEVRLTSEGYCAIEEAILNPKEKTHGFPSLADCGIMNIGNDVTNVSDYGS